MVRKNRNTAKREKSIKAAEAELSITGLPIQARVCFCGRPNVGKSSLFNRIIGRKKALVLDLPGVTRDVYRHSVLWNGHRVELADLAGLEWADASKLHARSTPKKVSDKELLKKLATEAALDYLKKADLVLFVMDGRQPLSPDDEDLARLVRASNPNVVLVISKIEGSNQDRIATQAQAEAATLGWGEGLVTSAEHNEGIESLQDAIIENLGDKLSPKSEPELDPEAEHENNADSSPAKEENTRTIENEYGLRSVAPTENYRPRGFAPEHPLRVGVYGRPNVGKSTLVNLLLGERRMITSPVAGTTVDAIDSDFRRRDDEGHERFYQIIDTAGIRRKSKTEQGVEVLSVVQAIKSVERVDVALFLIDGYEGVTDQDEKVAGELMKSGRPTVVIVNKWDLCRVDRDDYAERVRETLTFLDFAPVLFLSAEKGEGVEPLWDLIDEMLKQRMFVAPTGELNRFVTLVEGANNPMGAKLYYATQTSKNPPTITFLVNDPKKIHFAFERYIRNELRERYGWMGSPIKLVFKSRKRSPSKKAR